MQQNANRWILIGLAQLALLALAVVLGFYIGNIIQSNQTSMLLTGIAQNTSAIATTQVAVVPSDTPEPTQSESDTPPPTNTEVDTASVQPTETVITASILRQTLTAGTQQNPATEVVARSTCFVRTEDAGSVRVRVGPGGTRPSVTFLPAGGDIEAVAISPDEQWLKLDLPGVTYAWVAIDDVDTSGNCRTLARDDGSFTVGQAVTDTPTVELPAMTGATVTASPQGIGSGRNTFAMTVTPEPARTDDRSMARSTATDAQFAAVAQTATSLAELLRSTIEANATNVAAVSTPVGLGGGASQLPDSESVGGDAPMDSEAPLEDALDSAGVAVQPTSSSTPLPRTATSQPTATVLAPTVVSTSVPELVPETAGNAALEQPTSQFSPTPIVVANAPLQLRSQLSGDIIGDGVISLYAPDSVSGVQTARIELELNLQNIYITPTPAGQTTAFPIPTRITSTPRVLTANGTPLPTPTERIPIFEEQGLQFYQRMGASLFCPPEAFIGCDTDYDIDNARIIPISRPNTSFTWLLRAEDGIIGTQELTVELWHTGENMDGDVEVVTDWNRGFILEVIPPPVDAGLPNSVRIAIVVLSILGVILLTMFDWRMKPRAKSLFFDRENTDKPKVFISYRRRPSWSVARSLADKLQARGADVFLDVDHINEGRFAEVIQQAIRDCDYFVPILTPTTLESRWVRREIGAALDLDKVIIPFTTDEFSFYDAELPEGLEDLTSHNAIEATPEYFDAAVDRLAERFLKLEDDS